MFDIGAWRFGEDGAVAETLSGDELRGIHKLVQRVFIALLQEQGTVKYTYGKRVPPGCSFMTALRCGDVRSEMDVSAQFFLARHAMFAELKNEEHGDAPPDECFKDVRCKGIAIQPGVLKLKLHVQSQTAGITVWLPIEMPK